MSYYMNVIMLSENDLILGNIKVLLSVRERDCMGGFFTTQSSETLNHPL